MKKEDWRKEEVVDYDLLAKVYALGSLSGFAATLGQLLFVGVGTPLWVLLGCTIFWVLSGSNVLENHE